jgi:hypothetical protein
MDNDEQVNNEKQKSEIASKQNGKLKKHKKQKASKGIETMLRTTIESHLQLSVMADSKANLMISINAIIISIMFSSLAVGKYNQMSPLIIPAILLSFVCLLTITFSLLSTRPTIRLKKTDTETISHKKTDLLFFGEFTHLTANSYKESVKEMIGDQDLLYNHMIDNIYSQGKVLARKYRLLKIAYTIFLIGFVVVVLCYIVALLFYPVAM